jgi:hypothetical protein
MSDPALKDLTNPFNLRRIRWHDRDGFLHVMTVGILQVEETVARLREEGVGTFEVDRLAWTKVYEVKP